MVSQELLDILRCPKCKKKLNYEDNEDKELLKCKSCKLAYPVKNNIAVLLIEEAEKLEESGDLKDTFKRDYTPYDRMALSIPLKGRKKLTSFSLFETKMCKTLKKVCIVFISMFLMEIINLIGRLFHSKSFSEVERKRFLSRPVNIYGGNVIPDYITADFYYEHQEWEQPVLEIGVANGESSALFYPERTIDIGMEYVFENIRNGIVNESFANIKNVLCASAYSLPFGDGLFSTVIMTGVIHHLDPKQDYALSEIYRVVQSGGKLIFNTQSEHFFCNRSINVQIAKFFRFRSLAKLLMNIYRDKFKKSYVNITGFEVKDWREVLRKHGFEIITCQKVMSPLSSLVYSIIYKFYQIHLKYSGPFFCKEYRGLERLYWSLLKSEQNRQKSSADGSLLFIIAKKKH